MPVRTTRSLPNIPRPWWSSAEQHRRFFATWEVRCVCVFLREFAFSAGEDSAGVGGKVPVGQRVGEMFSRLKTSSVEWGGRMGGGGGGGVGRTPNGSPCAYSPLQQSGGGGRLR